MLRRIDLVRLFDRSMIEPKNDVSVIAIFVVEVWSRDSNGFIAVLREDCEGACRVEANAADGASIDIVLVHCSAHRRADASPDVSS